MAIGTYAKLSIEQTFAPQKNPSTRRPYRQVHFRNTLDGRALSVFVLLQICCAGWRRAARLNSEKRLWVARPCWSCKGGVILLALCHFRRGRVLGTR